jgi:hypothetical protein
MVSASSWKGFGLPLSGMAASVLVGMAVQTMVIDWGMGTRNKARTYYHAGIHGVDFPYNDVFEEKTGYKMDTFEAAAVAASAVAAFMWVTTFNVHELQLPLTLGAVCYLRREHLWSKFDAMSSNPKQVNKDSITEVKWWDSIIFVALVGIAYLQIRITEIPKATKAKYVFQFPTTAVGLSMLLGILVQDLIFDQGISDWKHSTKYYKDVTTANVPWKYAVPAMIAFTAISALLTLLTDRRSALKQLFALIPAGYVAFVFATVLEPTVAELRNVSEVYPGKQNKEQRQTESSRLLETMASHHIKILPIMVATILMQLWARYSVVAPAEEAAADDDKQKGEK